MTGSICSKVTKYYALNALMKLSTRFSTETERIQKVIHACVILINVTLNFFLIVTIELSCLMCSGGGQS